MTLCCAFLPHCDSSSNTFDISFLSVITILTHLIFLYTGRRRRGKENGHYTKDQSAPPQGRNPTPQTGVPAPTGDHRGNGAGAVQSDAADR